MSDAAVKIEPYEGMWDFDGSCAPGHEGAISSQMTFSLGCFQWVRRGKEGKGKGLKKGKVQYRIKGYTSEPIEAYRKAAAYCARKNSEPTNER